MLMNSNIIHSEVMKSDMPGFNDESNEKQNQDVVHVTFLLEYCILICFVPLIQQFGTENTC